MSSRRRAMVVVCSAVAMGAMAIAGSAPAAFPGSNGKIAFSHDPGPGPNTGIFQVDPSGQNQAVLFDPADTNDFLPSYSPDGEKVVFVRATPGDAPSTIWVVNHDGTNPIQLTNETSGAGDVAPQFSPNGQRIVFERRTGAGTGSAQLWIMNADGTGQTPLTSAPTTLHPHDPTFSPDGTKIAFSYGDPSNSGFHGIATINADGSGFTPLTTSDNATIDDYNPDYSPDGQRIVFQRFVGGDSDIYVMSANGANPTAVTTGPEMDFDPVFSPDGTRVAFEQEDPGQTFGNIVTANPSAVNQITPVTSYVAPEFGFQPTWQALNPPDCQLKGKKKTTSTGRIKVTVDCPDENATAVFTGKGSAPAPRGATVSARKKFKVKRKTVEVPSATPTKVSLKLSKKGKRAVKQAVADGNKVKVKVTATFTDDLGESAKDKIKVTIKPKG